MAKTYRNSSNDTVITGGTYTRDCSIYNSGNNVTITGGAYKDYIENTGSHALIYTYGSLDEVVNSGDNTYISTGDGDDTVTNRGKNVTIYGGAGKDTITTYGNNSLVSLGSDSNSVNAYANNVTIKASHGHQTIQSKAGSGTYIEGSDSDEIITIQRNGSGSGVVATVQGGGGNDTFNGSAGADVFVYTGTDGNDVIYNWDSNDQILLTSGSVDDSIINDTGDVVLNIGYSSITLKDAANKSINVVSDDDPVPTPSEETAVTLESSFTGTYDDYEDTIKKIDASKVTSAIEIYGNDNDNTITGGSKADTIYGGTGKDVLNGGAGNDELYGDDGNDKLNGGNGNDTLTGGAGADTLTGGAGKDVFYYDSGDGSDVITDYSDTQGDIIQLGVSAMSTTTSGSNVLLKIGSGQINVKSGKGKAISVVGADGNTTIVGSSVTPLSKGLSYSTDKKTLNAKAPFTGTIDLSKYASTVTTVNASTDTKFVSIKGTTRAETFRAGKGGSILTGGKGNDKLYGGSGADTFVYANGDGKDTIYNYTSYIDTIKVTSGKISKASVSGNNVILTVGSGSITVNNAKGKDINITDSTGETATYNFTRIVTNPTTSNYEERWFVEDDNFAIDSQLDSIVKTSGNDYSVGNISSNDSVKQIESLLKVTQSSTVNRLK